MKNNADFLEGIYKKAEILSAKKATQKHTPYIKYSSIAALFILVPLFLLYQNSGADQDPQATALQTPRTMSLGNMDFIFTHAEYVAKGTIVSTTATNDFLELRLSVEDTLFGPALSKEILVLGDLHSLGILETQFPVVAFLYKQEDTYYLLGDREGLFIQDSQNTYRDALENKYSIEEIYQKLDRSQ
jgi:hypothetical protein